MSLFGQADATGLSEGLEASRDIHAIAKQVTAPHYHVPDMDADTELKALLVRSGGLVRLGDLALDRQRTSNGVHHARELGEDAVPGRVGNTSTMLRDEAIDVTPADFERREGSLLVDAHHAGVARDIGGEDGQ
jgi:hypothetical protein